MSVVFMGIFVKFCWFWLIVGWVFVIGIVVFVFWFIDIDWFCFVDFLVEIV